MDANHYRIVDADLDDERHCAGLVHCLNDYAAGPFGRGEPLSAEVRAALCPNLRQVPSRLIRLVLHGEVVVGAAVCFVSFSTFAARPRLNVHDLCVLPAQRGKGLGRALLLAVISAARGLHCSGVTLEVRADNELAQGLYRSVGFSGSEPATWFWERKL